MHLVMTRVKLKANCQEACTELFKHANPDLIERERDWLSAQLVYHPESDVVTVLAKWRNAKSYELMRGSLRYQHSMRRFSELWAAPPEITVHEILSEFTSDYVGQA